MSIKFASSLGGLQILPLDDAILQVAKLARAGFSVNAVSEDHGLYSKWVEGLTQQLTPGSIRCPTTRFSVGKTQIRVGDFCGDATIEFSGIPQD